MVIKNTWDRINRYTDKLRDDRENIHIKRVIQGLVYTYFKNLKIGVNTLLDKNLQIRNHHSFWGSCIENDNRETIKPVINKIKEFIVLLENDEKEFIKLADDPQCKEYDISLIEYLKKISKLKSDLNEFIVKTTERFITIKDDK